MFQDNPVERLLSIIKEPCNANTTLVAYKTMHEILDFDFINKVDYSLYSGSTDIYIKTPIDLVIDICMHQIDGFVQAFIELLESEEIEKKYDIDLKSFLTSIVQLSTITIISNPEGIPGSLSSKAEEHLSNCYKNACLTFNNEVSFILTMVAIAVGTVYSEEQATQFKDLTSEWSANICNIFLTIMITKSEQKRG